MDERKKYNVSFRLKRSYNLKKRSFCFNASIKKSHPKVALFVTLHINRNYDIDCIKAFPKLFSIILIAFVCVMLITAA